MHIFKKAFMYLTAVCFSAFAVKAQQIGKSRLIDSFEHYLFCTSQSANKKWIATDVGLSATIVMDTLYHVKHSIPKVGVYGGGFPVFTKNDSFLVLHHYGDPDTLVVVNMADFTKKEYLMPVHRTAAFHHSQRILLSENGKFSIFDIATGKTSRSLFTGSKSPGFYYNAFLISDDDFFVYASSRDNALKIYSFHQKKFISQFGPFAGEIENLVKNKDGKLLTFSAGEVIVVVNTQTGKVENQIPKPDALSSLAFDPTSKVLLAGTNHGVIWQYDLQSNTNKQYKMGPANKEYNAISDIYFLSNGKILVAVSDLLYEVEWIK